MDAELEPVRDDELAAAASLINLAFGSRRWELDPQIFTGSRITEVGLSEELAAQPNGFLLQWKNKETRIGCVFLAPTDEARSSWYMGYLCMDPKQQGTGLGVKMLTLAERWAQQRGAKEIRLKVVNVREPLIAWYLRRGYHVTGEDEIFPYDHFPPDAMLFENLRLVGLQKTL